MQKLYLAAARGIAQRLQLSKQQAFWLALPHLKAGKKEARLLKSYRDVWLAEAMMQLVQHLVAGDYDRALETMRPIGNAGWEMGRTLPGQTLGLKCTGEQSAQLSAPAITTLGDVEQFFMSIPFQVTNEVDAIISLKGWVSNVQKTLQARLRGAYTTEPGRTDDLRIGQGAGQGCPNGTRKGIGAMMLPYRLVNLTTPGLKLAGRKGCVKAVPQFMAADDEAQQQDVHDHAQLGLDALWLSVRLQELRLGHDAAGSKTSTQSARHEADGSTSDDGVRLIMAAGKNGEPILVSALEELAKHLGSELSADNSHEHIRKRVMRNLRTVVSLVGRLPAIRARAMNTTTDSAVRGSVGYYGRAAPMSKVDCKLIDTLKRLRQTLRGHRSKTENLLMDLAPPAAGGRGTIPTICYAAAALCDQVVRELSESESPARAVMEARIAMVMHGHGFESSDEVRNPLDAMLPEKLAPSEDSVIEYVFDVWHRAGLRPFRTNAPSRGALSKEGYDMPQPEERRTAPQIRDIEGVSFSIRMHHSGIVKLCDVYSSDEQEGWMSADEAREIYCNGSFEWDAEDVRTFERMMQQLMVTSQAVNWLAEQRRLGRPQSAELVAAKNMPKANTGEVQMISAWKYQPKIKDASGELAEATALYEVWCGDEVYPRWMNEETVLSTTVQSQELEQKRRKLEQLIAKYVARTKRPELKQAIVYKAEELEAFLEKIDVAIPYSRAEGRELTKKAAKALVRARQEKETKLEHMMQNARETLNPIPASLATMVEDRLGRGALALMEREASVQGGAEAREAVREIFVEQYVRRKQRCGVELNVQDDRKAKQAETWQSETHVTLCRGSLQKNAEGKNVRVSGLGLSAVDLETNRQPVAGKWEDVDQRRRELISEVPGRLWSESEDVYHVTAELVEDPVLRMAVRSERMETEPGLGTGGRGVISIRKEDLADKKEVVEETKRLMRNLLRLDIDGKVGVVIASDGALDEGSTWDDNKRLVLSELVKHPGRMGQRRVATAIYAGPSNMRLWPHLVFVFKILRLPPDVQIMDAELMGILEAMEMGATMVDDGQTIITLVDSEGAADEFEKLWRAHTYKIMKKRGRRHLGKRMVALRRQLRQRQVAVILYRIEAHKGAYPNMVADAAASIGLDYEEITDTTWDEHDELIAFRAKRSFGTFKQEEEWDLMPTDRKHMELVRERLLVAEVQAEIQKLKRGRSGSFDGYGVWPILDYTRLGVASSTNITARWGALVKIVASMDEREAAAGQWSMTGALFAMRSNIKLSYLGVCPLCKEVVRVDLHHVLCTCKTHRLVEVSWEDVASDLEAMTGAWAYSTDERATCYWGKELSEASVFLRNREEGRILSIHDFWKVARVVGGLPPRPHEESRVKEELIEDAKETSAELRRDPRLRIEKEMARGGREIRPTPTELMVILPMYLRVTGKMLTICNEARRLVQEAEDQLTPDQRRGLRSRTSEEDEAERTETNTETELQHPDKRLASREAKAQATQEQAERAANRGELAEERQREVSKEPTRRNIWRDRQLGPIAQRRLYNPMWFETIDDEPTWWPEKKHKGAYEQPGDPGPAETKWRQEWAEATEQMLAAEVAAKEQQQETAEGEGAGEDDGTNKNEEAAESEEVEEELSREEASPVRTMSRRQERKSNGQMRSRSPCSEGSAASQSESGNESEGSGSDSSGGRSKKKWSRRKRKGGTGSSPKKNEEARTKRVYMRLTPGFESDEQTCRPSPSTTYMAMRMRTTQ